METIDQSVKVLHIYYEYVSNQGGVKRVLHELVLEQNKVPGMQAWVYASKEKHLIDQLGQAKKASIDQALAHKPDLAIFHSLYSDLRGYGKITKALKKEGIPYLIEPHGNLAAKAMEKSGGKKRLVNHFLVDRWIKQARAIVYLCEEERQASRLQNMKSVVIPNSYPRPFAIAKEAPLVHQPVRLLMVSRIDPYHKGLDRFFQTLQALPQEAGSQITVDIYGFGSQADIQWLQGQAAAIKHIQVAFHGPIYKEEKTKAFQAADLFCLFSRYEGLPLSLYEAAASGLPVIVTEGSNRVDWVTKEKNGFVLYDHKEDQWGKELMEMVESYLKTPNVYKENALGSARQLPTWEEIASKTKDVYKRLVEENDE